MTLILKLISQKAEEFWIVTVALLVAFTIAANPSTQVDAFGFFGNYLYWIARMLMEAAFFIAVLFAVEKYLKQRLSKWSCYLLAMLLSLVPFTLAITAIDIILGLPELGLNADSKESVSRGWEFVLELFYLLDNHLVFGAMLLIPRFLLRPEHPNEVSNETRNEITNEATVELDTPESIISHTPLTFFDSLDKPLEGRICSMEAQEHYILVTTTEESRMILHRFSDAVQRTPDIQGMRVHRSHWVAHSAVKEVVIEGQSMKLKLADDRMIPVSRTFRTAVESKYSG